MNLWITCLCNKSKTPFLIIDDQVICVRKLAKRLWSKIQMISCKNELIGFLSQHFYWIIIKCTSKDDFWIKIKFRFKLISLIKWMPLEIMRFILRLTLINFLSLKFLFFLCEILLTPYKRQFIKKMMPNNLEDVYGTKSK